MARKKVYHVVRRDDGWVVRGEDAERAISIYSTQREAVHRARELAQGRGNKMVVHGRDGQILYRSDVGPDLSPQSDRTIQPSSRDALGSASDEETHSDWPSVDVWIDPGLASSDDLAELYTALSELHRAHGGAGIDFCDDDTRVYSSEEVSS